MLCLGTWGGKTDPFPCQDLPWAGEGMEHQAVRQDCRLQSLSLPQLSSGLLKKSFRALFLSEVCKECSAACPVGTKCLNPSQVLGLSFNCGIGTAKPVSHHGGRCFSNSNLTLSKAFRGFPPSEIQWEAMPKYHQSQGQHTWLNTSTKSQH